MSSFTPEQARAIQSDANLVVTAGAGAGKTRVLTERWIRLLMNPALRVDQVVAITFTEKAAAEMLERCRKELRKLARSATPAGARARQLLEQLPEARISTFHSFCQSVLRFYPVEAALDPEFRVADDMEAGTLLAAAVDETLTAAAASADEPVVDLLARFGRSRLAEHLQRLISQMRNLGESPASLRQATLAAAARLGPRDGLTLPVRLAVADLLAYQTKPGSKGREQQEQLAQTWARLDPLLADGLAGEGALTLVAELRTMAGAINGNSLKPKQPLVEAVNAVEAALWRRRRPGWASPCWISWSGRWGATRRGRTPPTCWTSPT
jgi:ATP-dependent exoDNAse (exonuclease V) beta subunit